MPPWVSFSCLSSLTVSLMPPPVPQTPPHFSYTLQDEHMLFSISGFSSPRLFLRTPLSDFAQPKDPSPPTSFSHVATWSPSSRLSSMLAPFIAPSLSIRSHYPLLSQACTKGFFSISSFFLTAMDYSWNFLVSLVPCPCLFSYWSSFSTPSMLHCSHSCWSIFLPNASCPCLTCINPSVSLSLTFISSLSSSSHVPLLLSSRNVKSSAITLKWLKPTLVPKEILCLPPPLQLLWLHSDPA